jgi:hypothetical protein
MSNLTDKSGWPPEYASDLKAIDARDAARLLSDPLNLAELDELRFEILRKAVNDFNIEMLNENSLEDRAAYERLTRDEYRAQDLCSRRDDHA